MTDQIFKDYPDVVGTTEACEMLHITKNTLYKLLQTRQLSYRKIGRVYRIRKSEIISFLSYSDYIF